MTTEDEINQIKKEVQELRTRVNNLTSVITKITHEIIVATAEAAKEREILESHNAMMKEAIRDHKESQNKTKGESITPQDRDP